MQFASLPVSLSPSAFYSGIQTNVPWFLEHTVLKANSTSHIEHSCSLSSSSPYLFLHQLSFRLIGNKLKKPAVPHHPCANVGNEIYVLLWRSSMPYTLSLCAYKHTACITILPLSKDELQRSNVVALGFPSVQLDGLPMILTWTCKQRNSTNHHNYKIWSVLWVALGKPNLDLANG